ncbi:hypothetical protein EYZ11_011504 [Aspergillus tanneri]|uniref:Uncharacterized protein n=1 Tax=Aspergillus tanneri TaxID=1220188 RepID=A0A4S3J4S1_9EURO|nr:hypothetical protein EYZ11_011504 [Aspergillus tanneri]
MELVYFPESAWIGKLIYFFDIGYLWTDNYKTTACAGTTFKCQKLGNPAQEALMKVLIEVPYSGTEFHPLGVRGA